MPTTEAASAVPAPHDVASAGVAVGGDAGSGLFDGSVPTHADALPLGARLGEFEIRRLLGVGGFGMVYEAFDHSLERPVAVKEYMPQSMAGRRRGGGQAITLRSAADQQSFALGLRSFVNEARMLAQFDHPALVKVHRFWEANNTAYMVMPCYSGITLKAARRQMRCPPPEAWLRRVLGPVLGALQTLHAGRTTHRDISPDNILLQDIGPPVLLDLGAARRAIEGQSQQHTAILKVNYAPIEQYADTLDDLRQGPWTDLYALAAVVHGVLCNDPPQPATFRLIQDRMPPMAQVARTVAEQFGQHYGDAFVQAIDRALAVRPEGRPQSVAEFSALLQLDAAGDLSAFNWRAELGDVWAPSEQAEADSARMATAADADLGAGAASAHATAPGGGSTMVLPAQRTHPLPPRPTPPTVAEHERDAAGRMSATASVPTHQASAAAEASAAAVAARVGTPPTGVVPESDTGGAALRGRPGASGRSRRGTASGGVGSGSGNGNDRPSPSGRSGRSGSASGTSRRGGVPATPGGSGAFEDTLLPTLPTALEMAPMPPQPRPLAARLRRLLPAAAFAVLAAGAVAWWTAGRMPEATVAAPSAPAAPAASAVADAARALPPGSGLGLGANEVAVPVGADGPPVSSDAAVVASPTPASAAAGASPAAPGSAVNATATAIVPPGGDPTRPGAPPLRTVAGGAATAALPPGTAASAASRRAAPASGGLAAPLPAPVGSGAAPAAVALPAIVPPAAPVAPAPREPAADAAATAARALCADTNFLSRPMCLYNECQKPAFARAGICVEFRRQQESAAARRDMAP